MIQTPLLSILSSAFSVISYQLAIKIISRLECFKSLIHKDLTIIWQLLYTQNMDDDSIRWWDWVSTSLFLIFLMTAATRLMVTKWTLDLDRVQMLALLGGVIGLIIGQSRFSTRTAFFLGAGYGAALIFSEWIGTYGSETPALEAAGLLVSRLGVSITTFFQGRAVPDPILFQVGMSLLLWGIASTSGFQLVRRANPWIPFILPAIVLVIVDHFNQRLASRGLYILVGLISGLLMVFRVQYLRAHRDWRSHRIFFPPESLFDLTRNAFILLTIAVLIGWSIPAVSETFSPASTFWADFSRPFDKIRQQISNAFTSLKGGETGGGIYDANILNLGLNANMGSRQLFSVQPSLPPRDGNAYYWRVRIYEDYESGVWKSTEDPAVDLPQNAVIPEIQWNHQLLVHFRFLLTEPSRRYLYSGPSPVQINREVQYQATFLPDGKVDVTGIETISPIPSDSYYEMDSLVNQPAAADLRSSGVDYPDWIKNRYLQLPPLFPARIVDLTRQITQGLDNPYDQTQAVTQYLRTHIKYSTSLNSPPANQDPVEWFLFEKKEGFCNYYATAEVLMLRSIGIPSRLAAGYKQGGFDQQNGIYTVREKDSHAWPEIFFSGSGWVEFEPTSSVPAVSIPDVLETAEQLDKSGGVIAPERTRDLGNASSPGNVVESGLQSSVLALLWRIAAVILLIAAGGYATVRWWKQQRAIQKVPPLPVYLTHQITRHGWSVPLPLRWWTAYSLLSDFQKAFYWTDQSFRLIGLPPNLSSTFSERAAHWMNALPECKPYAEILIHEMEKTIYSPLPGNITAVQSSCQQINHMVIRETFHRILNRMRQI